jgi:hypothetical protein
MGLPRPPVFYDGGILRFLDPPVCRLPTRTAWSAPLLRRPDGASGRLSTTAPSASLCRFLVREIFKFEDVR